MYYIPTKCTIYPLYVLYTHYMYYIPTICTIYPLYICTITLKYSTFTVELPMHTLTVIPSIDHAHSSFMQ